MLREIITIFILLTFTFTSASAFNIEKAVKIRSGNTTLSKPWYNFTDVLIKNNFYYNQTTLEDVENDLSKIKELVWREDLYYLILWMLKTESNITPIWWIKAGDFYKSRWGFLYKWFYIKCKNDKKLPIWAWKVVNNQWFDVSNQIYRNYKWNRRGYLSQFIAFCEFRAILTKEEKEFYDNWKTSYIGAIWPFQFLPLNITKKLNLEQWYKKWDIFKVSWYAKAIYRFLQYHNYNYSFKNPEDLAKCDNYFSRKYPECKELRERIYWYNHSTKYINKIIKNAVKLWRMDRSWLFTSPVNNFWIYPDTPEVVIKIKNAPTKVTQTYKFYKTRWHPAIDIAPILPGVNNRIKFINKNNLEIIWNSNKKANCYFINYWDNKESWFIKRTWNTLLCVTQDWKYLSLYAHLKKFNINLFKTHKTEKLTKNRHIIAWWLNWILNYPWKFNYSGFKNYNKLKTIVKVYNIRPWDLLWYMGNRGHSTWPHLHWVYVKKLADRIETLPLEFIYFLNKVKLYNK